MTLSVSNIVKPSIKQFLGSLMHLVESAQDFCHENEIEEAVILQARLAPDMHPFIWQIQMVSEFAPRCCARLAELEVVNYPNVETSFDELKDRINMALAYVETIDDKKLDSGLERIQEVPFGPDKTIPFRGPIYLHHFFLPNFYFHISTAYNILRNNGVKLGKMDFMGNIPE